MSQEVTTIQAGLSYALHPRAPPPYTLIWEPLLVTVGAVGRMGQENKALAPPCL